MSVALLYDAYPIAASSLLTAVHIQNLSRRNRVPGSLSAQACHRCSLLGADPEEEAEYEALVEHPAPHSRHLHRPTGVRRIFIVVIDIIDSFSLHHTSAPTGIPHWFPGNAGSLQLLRRGEHHHGVPAQE